MKPLHLDPRTKLLLILLCVLSAMVAPSLYFQFTLVALIGLLSALSGRWQYALRGIIAYALIGQFTGIILIDSGLLWGLGTVLAALDVLLMRGTAGNFTYEKLLK